MSSDEEGGGFLRDEDASQELPPIKSLPRPAKRKRNTRPIIQSSEYDSMADFIENDEEEDRPKKKQNRKRKQCQDSVSRGSVSREASEDRVDANSRRQWKQSYAIGRGSISQEEDDDLPKQKKSKYKIHIVQKEDDLPAPVVQYGTQVGEEPDSSPYRIRGAMWKLPRSAAKDIAGEGYSKASQIEKKQATLQDFAARKVAPAQHSGSVSTPKSQGESTFGPASAQQAATKRQTSNAPTPTNAPPQPKDLSTCTPSLDSTPLQQASVPSKSISPPALPSRSRCPPPRRHSPARPPIEIDIEQELADLPSDAFSSEPEDEFSADSKPVPNSTLVDLTASQPRQRIVAPTTGLRQTTLFGGRASAEVPASQVNKVRNYRVDMPPEEPTHHKIDREAMKHWVYPTNLGAIRDYQYSIVKNGLFNNMLVALPTGLGKTFIAATIMLNYFRWFPQAQIVFVAPTKPLCAQQIEACYNNVGIPRSSTILLTGEVQSALRAKQWEDKRVFFMTPQTLENDLSKGSADPKKIVLLVVDEAHRAKGNYAYVKVVSFLRRFNKSFRVLALTATPGSSVEAVQEVINGLEVSKVEIRTEESLDIQQYVHRRNIEQVVLEPSDEINKVKELFSKALKPLVDLLAGHNAYYNRDPMALTTFGLIQAQRKWMADQGRHANPGKKGMISGLFGILQSVAHSIKLLNFHGISPFFQNVKEFRQSVEEKGQKAGKYRKQINDSPDFRKMMDMLQAWINQDEFIGHPKLTYLCDAILNHFLDAGDGRRADDAPPSSTRVIVFSEFRDSAEEIVRILNRHKPMIKASVFVGQADSKRSEGMNQNIQQDTIDKFKNGIFNVLVATSIGEEGLDIGQVDLIVCYDASASPIRMLQRMGRTGRKRAGNIVLLLMKGKEEQSWVQAQDNYEKMQKLICEGSRFTFRHSVRIVPRDVAPEVDKRAIEIPKENELDSSMPEPKRRFKNQKRKKPTKKFHMPDGVPTGFRNASRLTDGRGASSDEESVDPSPSIPFELTEEQQMSIPSLESVLLTDADLKRLEMNYQKVHGGGDEEQVISFPDTTLHPLCQRSLRPVKFVKHGSASKRFVKMINAMKAVTNETIQNWRRIYQEEGSVQMEEADAKEIDVEVERSPTPTAVFTSSISHLENDVEAQEESGLNRHYSHPVQRPAAKKYAHFRYNVDDSDNEGSVISNSHAETDSDLDDFIVPDDEDPFLSSKLLYRRSQGTTSSRSTSPPTIPGFRRKVTSNSPRPEAVDRPKRFFEPTIFAATQESGADEMPELGDLLGQTGQRQPLREKSTNTAMFVDSDVMDSDSDHIGMRMERAKKRKRTLTVVESDSDE